MCIYIYVCVCVTKEATKTRTFNIESEENRQWACKKAHKMESFESYIRDEMR